MYIWTLYNLINQCHPNKFNKENSDEEFKTIYSMHISNQYLIENMTIPGPNCKSATQFLGNQWY